MSKQGWIGVDLDGTLAEHYEPYRPLEIGQPIPKMVDRVKRWHAEGKRVRIVTARVNPLWIDAWDQHDAVLAWCIEHLGFDPVITCCKDPNMIELWDDRAIQVVRNTGQTVAEMCGLDDRANDLTA